VKRLVCKPHFLPTFSPDLPFLLLIPSAHCPAIETADYPACRFSDASADGAAKQVPHGTAVFAAHEGPFEPAQSTSESSADEPAQQTSEFATNHAAFTSAVDAANFLPHAPAYSTTKPPAERAANAPSVNAADWSTFTKAQWSTFSFSIPSAIVAAFAAPNTAGTNGPFNRNRCFSVEGAEFL
jgi:hypothetical protein